MLILHYRRSTWCLFRNHQSLLFSLPICLSLLQNDWCQAAIEKDNNSGQDDVLSNDNSNNLLENVEATSSKMNELSLSGSAPTVAPPTSSTECPALEDQVQDIDKKIRALKKKVILYSTSSLMFFLSIFYYLQHHLFQILMSSPYMF